MTPQGAKAKGRTWENDVVEWLIDQGVLHAERRRLAGAADKGDIAGIPGVVIECKHEKAYDPVGWVREAVLEAINAKADIGVVFARQIRRPGAENGLIMMTPGMFMRLLRQAGYVGE